MPWLVKRADMANLSAETIGGNPGVDILGPSKLLSPTTQWFLLQYLPTHL